MTKLDLLVKDYRRALEKLDEVLQMEETEVVRDSAIQRFEFCFDLAWKSLKAKLAEEFGVIVRSPKSTFREAYKQGLIEYDAYWITLTDRRNETVHTYKETLAKEVYGELPKALSCFQGLLSCFASE